MASITIWPYWDDKQGRDSFNFFHRKSFLWTSTFSALFWTCPHWALFFCLNLQVWMDAATQIFYSLGVSMGALVTFASYNKLD